MFCEKCGDKFSESAEFCGICGAKRTRSEADFNENATVERLEKISQLENAIAQLRNEVVATQEPVRHVAQQPVQQPTSAAPQSPEPIAQTAVQGNMQEGIANRKVKAIVTVIIALLMCVMSLGWFYVPTVFFAARGQGNPPNWFTPSDLRYINWNMQDPLQRVVPTPQQILEREALASFVRVITAVEIVVGVGALSFLLFLYYMHTGNKKAWRTGQISAIVVAAATTFLIGYFLRTDLERLALRGWHLASLSVWAYLMLALSIILTIYISKNKEEINR